MADAIRVVDMTDKCGVELLLADALLRQEGCPALPAEHDVVPLGQAGKLGAKIELLDDGAVSLEQLNGVV